MAHYHSSTPVDSAVEKIKRHPKYYLQGGDVHFLVESYLFRVHRYFFERESAYFRERLSIPAPAGQSPKGSSDANPFPLDGVAHHDFSRFLWIFYNPRYSIYDATADDWIAILGLAYDWRFPEVKRFACRELEKFYIAPLEKVVLYQRYELDQKLLIPSYIALCVRPEPLSIKEGRHLGLETALLIATARECARGKVENGARSPGPVSSPEDETVSIIKDVFGITNGPPSPSLTPVEDATPIGVMSPSHPSKFDPALTLSKPSITPYSTLGSASATVVQSLFGGSSGDVFSPTGAAVPNGAASANGAIPAGVGAGTIGKSSSRVVTAAEAAAAAALANKDKPLDSSAGPAGGGVANSKPDGVKGPAPTPLDIRKADGEAGKGAGDSKGAGDGKGAGDIKGPAVPGTPVTEVPGEAGGTETGDEGGKKKSGAGAAAGGITIKKGRGNRS